MPQMASRQRLAAPHCVSCCSTSWPDSTGQRITANAELTSCTLAKITLRSSSGWLWGIWNAFEEEVVCSAGKGRRWMTVKLEELAWGYGGSLKWWDSVGQTFMSESGFWLSFSRLPRFKTAVMKLWQQKEETARASVYHFGMAETMIS